MLTTPSPRLHLAAEGERAQSANAGLSAQVLIPQTETLCAEAATRTAGLPGLCVL